jgi:hypothetical protein
MDTYVSTLAAAVANPRTIGMLIASTARRAHIDAITISCQGAPADNTILWTFQRFTASGTATAKTAVKKDPASPASSCTTEENASVEPTYTSNEEVLDEGINQRSLARFVYAPGRELVTNITSDNGFGMKALHASATPTSNCSIEWVE